MARSDLPQPLPEPGRWFDQARCQDLPKYLFFPGTEEDAIYGQAVCRVCPVREECAQYAAENKIPHGTWGGITEWVRMPKRRRTTVVIKNKILTACPWCRSTVVVHWAGDRLKCLACDAAWPRPVGG